MFRYIHCSQQEDKVYLRIGALPYANRSINWLAMNYDTQDEISGLSAEEVFDRLPEYMFEDGVSVFDVDSNGLPIIDSLQLLITLANLVEDNRPCYDVVGTPIGTGNDGEPILDDAVVIGVSNLTKSQLRDHIYNTLWNNYRTHTSNGDIGFDIHITDNYVSYGGVKFSDPLPRFDTRTGSDYDKLFVKKQNYYKKKIAEYQQKIDDYKADIAILGDIDDIDFLTDFVGLENVEPFTSKSGKLMYRHNTPNKLNPYPAYRIDRDVDNLVHEYTYEISKLENAISKWAAEYNL